jgi:protein involved in polysaccharide export with SLBB domain
MPGALGDEIPAALRAQHLLVNPIVVVSVVEYAGRGVTVAGAVRTPITVQDLGNLRVLTALVQTGGLLPGAGPEIIVEQANGNDAAAFGALRRTPPGAEHSHRDGFPDDGAGM